MSPSEAPVGLGGARDRIAARKWKIVGSILGVALLVAAIISVARQGTDASDVYRSVRAAPAGIVALAAFLPMVSLALTGATFWLLTNRTACVGYREMFSLIGAAWLLNYLPLWPGMFGRLTYLRLVHQIPVTSSATVIVWAGVLSVLAAAIVGGATLAGSMFLEGDDWRLALLVALIPLGLSCIARVARARRDLPDPHLWRLLASLAIRTVEIQIWAARSAVCFWLIGSPIAWGGALAIASLTQLVAIIPVGGNGLGWREWVTGFAAPLLPMGLTLASGLDAHHGLTADLVNRVFEVLLAVPTSLACMVWLGWSRNRVMRSKMSRAGSNAISGS